MYSMTLCTVWFYVQNDFTYSMTLFGNRDLVDVEIIDYHGFLTQYECSDAKGRVWMMQQKLRSLHVPGSLSKRKWHGTGCIHQQPTLLFPRYQVFRSYNYDAIIFLLLNEKSDIEHEN